MKIILVLTLLVLAGCGTREYSIQRADGTEVGHLGLNRGIQSDEITLKEGNKERVFLCTYASTLNHTKCFESK